MRTRVAFCRASQLESRIYTNLVCIQMTLELGWFEQRVLVMIAIGEKALIRSGIYTSRDESTLAHYTRQPTTYFSSKLKGMRNH